MLQTCLCLKIRKFRILTDNAASALMRRSDKDGLARDAIHVDADGALDVIHVNVAVLGDEIDDVVLVRNLHGHRKVVVGLWGEEHVNRLLGEGLIARGALPHLQATWITQPLAEPRLGTSIMCSLPPWRLRTAKQNNVEGSGLPSILKVAKEAACPSIGWEH